MTELHDKAAPRRHAVEPNEALISDGVLEFASEPRSRVDAKGAMSSSANEALVRRAIEAIWNRGDLDVADELFAPDFVNHNGLITDLVFGPEAIKISAAFYRLAFPDLYVSVEALTIKKDIVVLCWTALRSADDPEGGAFSASQKLLTGITRSRFADGKIVESWTEWNRLQFS